MKFKLLNFLIFIFVSSFLLFPLAVSAVDYLPLVPCGLKEQPSGATATNPDGAPYDYTRPCTRCDAFKLTENVINFGLKGVVPPVAAVLFIYAGLMILLGGAMPKRIELGKTIFRNTFIGLLIILASWLIVNTFIQSFGPDQVKGSWFRFTCQDSVVTGPGGAGNIICSRPQELAAQYNVPSTPTNAPELNQLISCIRSNLPGDNLGSVATFGGSQDNRLCNFTRGERVCGSCIHAVNSCHYGGSSGTQGALAVDFGNEDIGDRIIGAAVQQCGAKNGRCEDRNGNFVSCLSSRATHVHINSRSCDRN